MRYSNTGAGYTFYPLSHTQYKAHILIFYFLNVNILTKEDTLIRVCCDSLGVGALSREAAFVVFLFSSEFYFGSCCSKHHQLKRLIKSYSTSYFLKS